MNPSNEAATIVVPGDLHLTTREQENYSAAVRVVEEINELVRPDFVQFIGDNVQDVTEEQFDLFDEIRRLVKAPHFSLVGDHDVVGDSQATLFRKRVGQPAGSTVLSGYRFVRLNTLDPPRLGFSDAQLCWLEDEFETARYSGERVVLFQHHYPHKVCESFAGPGVERWRALVNDYRPVATVCGHTHYLQFANDGRNVSVATRSIGDPEGGPAGYLVLHLQDDDFAAAYRTIEDSGPLVLITHPRALLLATAGRHVVSGDDEFRARIWSPVRPSRVVGSIDGGAWFDLLATVDGGWSAPLDGSRLEKGEHRVVVEARLPDGGRGRNDIRFFFDPTGRFTAVPDAQPVVRTTAFC
ncbi:MAG TPA: metallophosphoesterase [Planctomycetaceae bacterium]|nr:metallophosphoesterase [Planctomycetaceae bacterium]